MASMSTCGAEPVNSKTGLPLSLNVIRGRTRNWPNHPSLVAALVRLERVHYESRAEMACKPDFAGRALEIGVSRQHVMLVKLVKRAQDERGLGL